MFGSESTTEAPALERGLPVLARRSPPRRCLRTSLGQRRVHHVRQQHLCRIVRPDGSRQPHRRLQHPSLDQRLPLRFASVEPVGDDLRILARVQGRDHFLHA